MIDPSDLDGCADLARLGHVSRARITQVMNSFNLAPDIQEDILGLNACSGTMHVTEHTVRAVAAQFLWADQRLAFSLVKARRGAEPGLCDTTGQICPIVSNGGN